MEENQILERLERIESLIRKLVTEREEEMVGIVEAGKIIGYSKQSIYKFISQGLLTCTKGDNDRLLFKVSDLEQFKEVRKK
jgi:hypothetical protein